jgi:hypothetical protein
MKQLAVILFLCVCGLACCKKDRQCECKNSNGAYDAGEVTATKTKAKKICKELSTSTTECYLK